MKRLILIIIVVLFGAIVYSQNTDSMYYPEKDTSLNFIADSLNSLGNDIKEIGSYIKDDYNELGFVGFIRVYKYLIILALVFTALTLLWFRKNY